MKKNKLLPYNKVQKFAKTLKFKNRSQWYEYTKQDNFPKNIPKAPQFAYKGKGWKDWETFLGYISKQRKYISYMPFKKCRTLARSLDLQTRNDWKNYARHLVKKDRKSNLPVNPNLIYKNEGWKDWYDFLGRRINSKNRQASFISFKKCREFARSLNLKNKNQWRVHVRGLVKKNPRLNIPIEPDHVYKDKGWKNYGDFLGTGTIMRKNVEFLSFKECKRFAQTLDISSRKEWGAYVRDLIRKDINSPIPSSPETIYKDKGWRGWNDFLGKTTFITEGQKKAS